MKKGKNNISVIKLLLGLALVAGAFGAGIYAAKTAASRLDPFFNDHETELLIDDEPLYVDEIPDPAESDPQQEIHSSQQTENESQLPDSQDGETESSQGGTDREEQSDASVPTDSPLDPHETEIVP